MRLLGRIYRRLGVWLGFIDSVWAYDNSVTYYTETFAPIECAKGDTVQVTIKFNCDHKCEVLGAKLAYILTHEDNESCKDKAHEILQ